MPKELPIRIYGNDDRLYFYSKYYKKYKEFQYWMWVDELKGYIQINKLIWLHHIKEFKSKYGYSEFQARQSIFNFYDELQEPCLTD